MEATPVRRPTVAEAKVAQSKLEELGIQRNPLHRCLVGEKDIWIKLECLSEVGSFKVKGSGWAMAEVNGGVVTCSAGNMGQGVAWHAKRMGVPCVVVVPDHAPAAKLTAMEDLGATVIKVPYEKWWGVMEAEDATEFAPGYTFIHPCTSQRVLTGNAVIGLEILEDLPTPPDHVFVPYGGGSLCSGIASVVKETHPGVVIHSAEPETAAGFHHKMTAGTSPAPYTPSFVDGCGSKAPLPKMYPLTSSLIDATHAVKLEDVKSAMRSLFRKHHVVAEGAGACALAAALSDPSLTGTIVCVISGGCITPSTFCEILLE